MELRRAEPEDTDALAGLIRSVFPDNPKGDPDVLRWQFWDNPYGRACSWVWEDAGRLVSHFAIFPIPAIVDGQPVTATKPADAATAPSHRGKGLFVDAARAALAEAAERGYPLTICTPNPLAFGGMVKAGMVPIRRVPVAVRPLDERWLASRFKVPRALARAGMSAVFRARGGAAGEAVTELPDGLDELWARAAPRWGTRHDAAWWRWRYRRRPGGVAYRTAAVRRDGRLVAVALTRPVEAFGARFSYVLELIAEDGQAAGDALATAAGEAADTVGMAAMALPGNPATGWLGRGGLRRLPRRMEPRPFNFGLIDNLEPGRPTYTGEPWSLSWGDLDHL